MLSLRHGEKCWSGMSRAECGGVMVLEPWRCEVSCLCVHRRLYYTSVRDHVCSDRFRLLKQMVVIKGDWF